MPASAARCRGCVRRLQADRVMMARRHLGAVAKHVLSASIRLGKSSSRWIASASTTEHRRAPQPRAGTERAGSAGTGGRRRRIRVRAAGREAAGAVRRAAPVSPPARFRAPPRAAAAGAPRAASAVRRPTPPSRRTRARRKRSAGSPDRAAFPAPARTARKPSAIASRLDAANSASASATSARTIQYSTLMTVRPLLDAHAPAGRGRPARFIYALGGSGPNSLRARTGACAHAERCR